MDHSAALLHAFVTADRRDRYLGLLKNEKGRTKLRARLAHFHDLDPRYAHRIPPTEQNPSAIAQLLRRNGAPPTCYVLSESDQLDGKVLPLEQALEEVVGYGMGTFLSCVPGRLGYFEGEDMNERYLLSRSV